MTMARQQASAKRVLQLRAARVNRDGARTFLSAASCASSWVCGAGECSGVAADRNVRAPGVSAPPAAPRPNQREKPDGAGLKRRKASSRKRVRSCHQAVRPKDRSAARPRPIHSLRTNCQPGSQCLPSTSSNQALYAPTTAPNTRPGQDQHAREGANGGQVVASGDQRPPHPDPAQGDQIHDQHAHSRQPDGLVCRSPPGRRHVATMSMTPTPSAARTGHRNWRRNASN